ncbi:MAG: GNAT family N-acetyltransferase [Chloroflexota bacterium]
MPDAYIGAVISNFIETWWLLAGASGGERHEEAGIRWIAAGDHPILNAVLETRIDARSAPAILAKTVRQVSERSDSVLWWVLPGSTPIDLADRLRSNGFVEAAPWPGMAVELAALVEPPAVHGVELARVGDETAFDEYLAVLDPVLSPGPAFTQAMSRAGRSVGFGEDAAMAHYVAREHGEPVGCASLMVAGGAAGLYNVATVEAARRRGIGAWVSAAALLEGRDRGLEVGTLQSSPLGHKVYEQLGFREVCTLKRFRLDA